MKSYWKSFLFILFTITSTIISAQETCDNGVDDDGDGLIDCYDSECSDNTACEDFFFGNTVICADDIDVTTFAIREQWASEDETATSHVTPAIGDLDANGIPEVISINNYGSLDLYVLNGATGETIASADIGFTPENAPIIARIDSDEIGDIIVSQNKGDDLAMYNVDITTGTLTQIWRERASVNQPIGLPGVADFDEDGDVEIYYRNEIMDALTGTVIIAGDGNWEQDYTHGSIAIDVLPDAACADCAGLELVSGNEVWAINEATGTRTLVEDMDDDIHDDIDPNLNYYPKYYPSWDDQWSTVSAADYNLDGNIDVIITGALGTSSEKYNGETTIFFWDIANQNVITYHDPTNDFVRGPGRVNIGDVDGDGQLNANFVMDQKLYSLDENFNVHWIHPIKEGSSGFTGCSLFDFDGDGAVEVVYRSEESLLIVDGVGNGDNTTSERREIACISRTQEEYPVIADVDGDGSSEICVSCYTNNSTPFSPYSNTQFSQIRVYESDGEAWMPARGVWNQHGYYNVNINDDLTIPVEVQDHSVIFSTAGSCEYSDGTTIPFDNRPLNTFLNQAPILNEEGCVEFASPDIEFVGILSATDAACPDAQITVEYEIRNQGDIDISGSLPVSYYAGDPTTSDGVLLDTEIASLVNFEVGETLTITQTFTGIGGDFELFVVINDNGGTPPLTIPLPTAGIPECETGNNISSTLVGFQSFDLSVEKIFDNRKCVDSYVDGLGNTVQVPDNGQARAYYFGPTPGGNETFWIENFEDRSNGDKSDTDDTAWSSDPGTEGPSFYGVTDYNGSKMFNGRNTGTSFDAGIVTWTSEDIDISDHTDVSVTLDIFENGNQEASGEWRDFVRVTYEIRDNSNAVSSSGQFIGGFQVGDFTYAQAFLANLNPDGEDSLLIITAEIHNTSSSEYHYIDNISVSGTGPDILGEFTEPDGFNFFWFEASDTDFSDTLSSSSTFAQMPDGNYNVIGYFENTLCYSDTVAIEIQRVTPTVHVWAYEISPLTKCDIPDGSVGAFVYTQTQQGTFPANDTDNIPLDTLLVADGYEFNWRDNDDITNTYFATGNVISSLLAKEFAVDVIDLQTRCTNTALVEVTTNTEAVNDPIVTITPIATCGGTGELFASVDGDTVNFTFEWFDGNGVKPAVDHPWAIYNVSDPGSYTVRATSVSSSCPSDPVTVVMTDDANAPTPVATATNTNTSCDAVGNGSAIADGDGAGTTAGYNFTWYLGNNTLPANEMPAALAGSAFGAGDHELVNLTGGTYTVVVEDAGTSCTDTVTVDVLDNIVEPTYNFITPINSGNALQILDKAYIEIPQLLAFETAMTISFWVELSANNYASNHSLFSGGDNAQSVLGIWADATQGISATITTNSGGDASVFSNFNAVGWTNVAVTWDESTDLLRLFIDGVLAGEVTHTGSGGLDDGGTPMYFGRDSNLGVNKFEGNLDEFRIYDYAVSADDIIAAVCDPAAAAAGPVVYYDVNTETLTDDGDPIFDQSGNGNDGVIEKTGAAAGSITFQAADYDCPLADVINNTSCDLGNPNGQIDMTDKVDPIGANYSYSLYTGYTTTGTPTVNTSGIFTGLSDGFYTMVVTDLDTGCDTDPLNLSIASAPDNPIVATTPTDNTYCVDGDGTIFVTSQSGTAEPTSYTYEIFDGASFVTQIGTINIPDGSVGHTFDDLPGGTYRIRVTNDDSGCSSFVDEVVNSTTTTPLFDTPNVVDNTSCGAPNGFITVGIQGGNIANYLFTWYDGDDSGDPVLVNSVLGENFLNGIDGDPAGRPYTVVAVDAVTGCPTAELTIDVYDDPFTPDVIIVEEDPDTSCGVGNGTLRAYVTSDPDLPSCAECVTNYSFVWSYNGVGPIATNDNLGNNSNVTFSGTNNSTISGLSGDLNNYSVTATHNTLGCDVSENHVLTVAEPNITASLISSQDNTGCDAASADGEIHVSASPADTYTYEYFYSNGTQVTDGAPIIGSSTADVIGLTNDTYKVVAISSTNSCYSDTLSVVVAHDPTVPDFEGAAIGAGSINNTVCDETITGTFNGVAKVDIVSGSIGDYTVTWFDGSGTGGGQAYTVDAGDQTRYTELPGGTYTALIQNTAGNQCDTTIQVTIIDDPVAVTYTNTAAVDVTATPLTSCLGAADFPNGAILIDTTNIVGSGNYIFEVYYGGSVVDPDSLLDIAGTDNIYDQKTITDPGAAVNVALGYTGSVATVSGLNEGDYTIVAVDTDTGCRTTAATVNVALDPTVPDFEGAAIGAGSINNTVCDETITGTFNGVAKVDIVSGSIGDYTVTWFDGSGTGGGQAYTVDAGDQTRYTELPGGTYTALIQNTAGNQCDTTIQVTIIDDPVAVTYTNTAAVDVTATPLTSCLGAADFPNGAILIDTTNIVGSGNYIFEVYYGGSVVDPDSLLDIAGTDNIYDQKTITDPGAAVNVALGYTGSVATVSGLNEGDYTIVAVDTDTGCRTTAATVNVALDPTVPDFEGAAIGAGSINNTVCDETITGTFNGVAKVDIVSGSIGDYTVTWFDGSGTGGGQAYTVDAGDQTRYTELPGGTYTALIQNTAGNQCDTTIQVTIIDDPVAVTYTNTAAVDVTATPLTSCLGAADFPNGAILIDTTNIVGSGNYIFEVYYGGSVVDPDSLLDIAGTDNIYDQKTITDPGAAVNVALGYTGSVATVSGLNEGDYTIVAVDTDTGCRTTAATVNVALDPTVPDFEGAAIGAGSINNTVCDETITGTFNGVAKVDIVSGSIGDYTVTWFDGSGTGGGQAYTVDAGDQTRYTELPGGTYTALIQNTAGNQCDTTIQVTIIDDPVAVTYTNTAAVDVTATPLTSCLGAADFPNGAILIDTTNIVGSGNYIFEVYYGGSVVDPDSLLDIAGTDNIYDQKTITDPGAAVNVALGYTGSVATVSGLNEGDYTIVAVDTDTGCRTTAATVNVALDPTVPDFEGAAIGAGSINNTVCDETITGTFNGVAKVDIVSGSIGDYTVTWFDGSGTGGGQAYTVDAGDQTRYTELPGGTYTALIQNTAGNQCDTTIQVTIIDDPVAVTYTNTAAVDVTATPLTSCLGAADFPNGAILIDTTNIVGSGNYIFEVYYGGSVVDPDSLLDIAGTDNIYDQKTITDPGAAVNVALGYTGSVATVSGLNEGDYTIVAVDTDTGCRTTAATVNVALDPTVPDFEGAAIGAGSINNTVCDETITGTFNGVAKVDIVSGSIGDYTVTWFDGSGTGGGQAYTVDAGDQTRYTELPGGTYTALIQNTAGNQCDTTIQVTIIDDPVAVTYTNTAAVDVTATPLTSCLGAADFPNGAILIDTTNIVGSGNYIFEVYYGGSVVDPDSLLDIAGTDNIYDQKTITDPGAAVNVALGYTGSVATVSGLNEGDYTIVAVDTDTGCRTTAATVNVALDPTVPDFEGAAIGAGSINNTVCDETITGTFNGVAKVDIVSGSIGDYTVTWFDGSGTGGGQAYTVDAGDQTRYTELPGGTYTALIQNTAGNQCDTTIQVTIIDDPVAVTYTNTAAVDVTATPLTSCLGAADFPNGAILIDTTNIVGSGNYIFEVYYGGSVVDPDSLLDIAGTDNIYDQKTITDPGAAVNVALGYTGSVATVSGLNEGDYTIVAVDTDTGCRTTAATVNVALEPVTFTPSVTVIHNQTSCNLNDPNGELSADADGVGTVVGYTFEWFRGNSTNPSDEVTLQFATAIVFGTNGSQVRGLPAGTYTVKVTDGVSTCYYTAEETILNQQVDPIINGAVVVDDSDQCEPGNGSLTITVNDNGSTNTENGAGGYTFELFEGTSLIGTPLQTINQTTVSGPNDEATAVFTGLSEGDYTIRATDNNTSCLVVSAAETVGYDGEFLTYDIDNIFKDPLTACFDNDGILDFLNAVSASSGLTGDITITWYVGTDTSNTANLVANVVNNPVFSDQPFGGFNIINSRVENLPAIVYSGVIEYANGCKDLFNTELTNSEAPEITIQNVTDPSFCDPTLNSFEIFIDPVDGDAPSEFNYFVFQGDQAIAPDADVPPAAPYSPNLSSYGPIILQGTFTNTNTAAGQTETIIVDNVSVPGGLAPGTYTVAIEVDDIDRCITNVRSVIIPEAQEPSVALNTSSDNTVCDVSGGLTYNGFITVDATHPILADAADFTWYEDLDDNGTYDPLLSGAGSGVGFNVANETENGVTTNTVTGLGEGKYRVVIENNAGACTDTLDVEIFDSPIIYSIGNTSDDTTHVNIINCLEFGAFTLERILQNGVVDPASDTEAEIQAAFDLTWNNLTTSSVIAPNISETSADNLTAGLYRIDIVSLITGCTTSYDFEITDDSVNPALALDNKSADTQCVDADFDGDGALTITISENGVALNAATVVANYVVEWYRGTYDNGSYPGTGDNNFLADDGDGDNTNSGQANVGTALINGDILSMDGLENGTYTVFITKDGGAPNDNCADFATFTIDNVQPSISIPDAGTLIVNNTNCGPGYNGRIRVDSVREGNTFYPMSTDANNYDFTWTGVSTGFASGTTQGLRTIANLEPDTYVLNITNRNTGCPVVAIDKQFEVGDDAVSPALALDNKSADTQCVDADFDGDGALTITISENGVALNAATVVANYVVEWYRGTYDNGSYPGTGDNNFLADDGDGDNTNSGQANVGTALINGDILSMDGLENGTYTVFITKDGGAPNDNCADFATFTIDNVQPSISIPDAGTLIVNNTNCGPGYNGRIRVDSVREGNTFYPMSTDANNYDFTWTGVSTGFASGTTQGLRTIANLEPDTYVLNITNRNTGCPVVAIDKQFEVGDDAVSPALALDTKSADTQCVDADFDGDGALTITISENGVALNAATVVADYVVEWYRGTYDNGSYPGTGDNNFLADDGDGDNTNSGQANVGTALINGDILSMDGLENGTYTVFITKDGGAPNDNCADFATFTIDNVQPSISIPDAGTLIVNNTNCGPGYNGRIRVDSVREGNTFYPMSTDANNYDFTWTGVSTGFASGTTQGLRTIANLEPDTYVLNITNRNTGCPVVAIDKQFEVGDDAVSPALALDTKSADTQCVDADFDGDGALTITISENGVALNAATVVADYVVEWYRGTYDNGSYPGTGDNNFLADDGDGDNTNSGQANVGTALINGDILSMDGLENGTYTVFITKDGGAPNDNCADFATFTIDNVQPSISIPDAGTLIVNNTNCGPGYNGRIRVDSVREGNTFYPMSTDANNYDFTWTGVSTGFASGTTQGLRTIANLEPDTYVLNITNRNTGCPVVAIDKQFEVGDDAVSPALALDTKSADTQCVDADFDGDGALTITISENGVALNAATVVADYVVEWYRGTYDNGSYPGTGDNNFLADDGDGDNTNSGQANVGTALINGDILSMDGLENGTYTVFITKDGGAPNDNCADFATFTIDNVQPSISIPDAGTLIVNNTNCGPGYNGRIRVDSVREGNTFYPMSTDANNYDFTWTGVSTGFASGTTQGLRTIANLEPDTYVLNITNRNTGCPVVAIDKQFEVGDDAVSPALALDNKSADTQCVDADFDGDGALTITISENGVALNAATVVANYVVEWYRGTYDNGSYPGTGDNNFLADDGDGDNTNSGQANVGTALINGDILSMDGLENGTYTVFITKDGGAPNDNCADFATFTIDNVQPSISIPDAGTLIVNNTNCGPGYNGRIRVDSVREGNTFYPMSTDANNYDFTWTGVSTGFASGTTQGLRTIANLEPDTYVLNITNRNTGCPVVAIDKQFEVGDDAVSPALALDNKSADTQCVDADFDGDGALTITISENGVALNAATVVANYVVEWYRGTYDNGSYPGTGDNNFLADDGDGDNTNSGQANVGTALINGDILSMDGLENGTYTVFITKDGGAPNDNCADFATFTIDNVQPSISIPDAGTLIVNNTNCGPGYNGRIRVDSVREGNTFYPMSTDANNYDFTWTGVSTGFASGTTQGLRTIANLEPDTYVLNITNRNTGCPVVAIDKQFEVGDDAVSPALALDNKSADTQCVDADFDGDGALTITISENGVALNAATVVANYVVEWYRGTYDNGSYPGTGDNNFLADDGDGDNTNSGQANVGTALINGDILSMDGLENGTYTVFITKDGGAPNDNCADFATFSVISNPVIPTLNESAIQARAVPDTICVGTPSGGFVINDTDVSTNDLTDFEIRIYTGAIGVGELPGSPYTNTAATSISYTDLAADDYYITAENTASGCFTATAVINVKDSVRNPQISLVSVTPNEDCGGGIVIGGLEVIIDNVYDENDHFNVQWFTGIGAVGGNEIGGANSVILSGVTGGPYSVEVENINTGCISTKDFTIPTQDEALFITDYSVDNVTYCIDNGSFAVKEISFGGVVIDSAQMVIDGIYDLEVYTTPGNVLSGVTGTNPNEFIIENLGIGSYYAIVRKTDSQCESDPIFFDIEENIILPDVIISVVAADSTCSVSGTAAGSLSAEADGNDDSNTDYTFEWFTGSGVGSPLGITTSTITGLDAGTYTVRVTYLPSGCSQTAELDVPSAPADLDIISATVTGATSCTPANGTITVTAVSSGLVTDYNFDYYDTDPTAGGATPVFTGAAGAAYTVAEAGTYWIIGTHITLDCTTPPFQVSVNENILLPELSLDDFDFQANCDPNNPNGRLLVLADGQPENATYDFEWYFGTGTGNPLTSDDYTGGGNLAGASTNEVSGIAAGFYTVEVTNIATGCTITETYEMVDNIPNPIAISTSTSANTSCVTPNGKAAVSVISPAPGRSITDYSYYWFIGDLATVGTSPNPANADYTGTLIEGIADGPYVVLVIDQIDNFCQSNAIEVNVEDGTSRPQFELTTSDVTVCFDEKDGYASVEVTDISTVDIAWYDNTNTLIGSDFFVDHLDAGTYRLLLTHVITGCTSEQIFDIFNNAETPSDPFVLVNNGRNNCQFANGSAIANVDGVTNNYLFEWFDPSDMTTPYATGSEVFNLDTTTYLVRATNLATGCESAFTSVDIGYEVIDPVYDVIFNNSVCLRTEDGSTNQFTGTAIISFEEFQLATEYEWRDESGAVVGSDSRLIDAYPGNYTVTFTAENGCSYSASFTIETSLTIYNGVSANGDGKNDFFLVDCIDYFPNNNLKIFNRAGQRVYDIDGYDNTSTRFEGISNVGSGGLQLPAGTYFYIIDLGNGEDPVQGYLELVR
ncbi:gliding motility-associated C-terminal domain-containing protein [Ekhidna sp. To15]|uniref:T9SS type B sorting domain-containing protein n=1 Tax=Ekhidna sp. To15 TaxID=3395267 RepID=UPI003F52391A